MSNRNRQRRHNSRQDHINDDRWFDDDGGQNESSSGYSSEGRSRSRSNGEGNGGEYRSSYTGSQGGSGYGRSESVDSEGGWGRGDSGRGYGEAGYPGHGNFSDQDRYSQQHDQYRGSNQGRYGSYSGGRGQSNYVAPDNFGQGVYPSSQHGFQQNQGYCPECGHTHRGSMGDTGYQSQGQMGGQSYGSSSGWQSSGQFGPNRQGQGGYDIPTDYNEGGYPPYSSRSGSSWRRHSQSDDFNAGYGGGNWDSQGSQQSWGNRQDSSLNRTGGNVSSDWWSYDGQRSNRSGKGPKGYKRSDERIKEDVNDRLSDGSIDASNVDVKVQNGEVTLTGTVESRRIKFHAETIAEQVLGVTDVTNQLRVANQSGSQSSRSGSDFDEKTSQTKSTSKTSSTSMTSGAR